MEYYRIFWNRQPSNFTVWEEGGNLHMVKGGEHRDFGPLNGSLRSHLLRMGVLDATGTLRKRELGPNKVYPRMARNGFCGQSDHEVRQSALVGVRIVSTELRRIMETVEPTSENSSAFGQRIRHVLINACTEVEASWKGILRANHYSLPGRKRDYDTNDYVKLHKAMRLGAWRVALVDYPAAGTFAPFRRWKSASPTSSLRWYDAYNKVKHDRETNLSKATLRNAIDATCAAWVMCVAQFGPHGFGEDSSYLPAMFRPMSEPQWPPIKEYCFANPLEIDFVDYGF